MKNVHDFQQKKVRGEKFTMLTCYDYTSACIVSATPIDCLLIGDSVAMTMHGHTTTIPATLEMMLMHLTAVARGAPKKFLIADMPFLSYRKSLSETMDAVQQFIQAGAHAIKLEGADDNIPTIEHIVRSGVPVMGHIGLTPQSVHQLGGFRVQGREEAVAARIKEEALALEKAGCFVVLLECVPELLAQEITASLKVPTIGIGAGRHVDGQVLIWQDLLGLNMDFQLKFVKTYFDGKKHFIDALTQYHKEVSAQSFPEKVHVF